MPLCSRRGFETRRHRASVGDLVVCILSGFLFLAFPFLFPFLFPICSLFLATANVWMDSSTVAKSSALSAGVVDMAMAVELVESSGSGVFILRTRNREKTGTSWVPCFFSFFGLVATGGEFVVCGLCLCLCLCLPKLTSVSVANSGALVRLPVWAGVWASGMVPARRWFLWCEFSWVGVFGFFRVLGSLPLPSPFLFSFPFPFAFPFLF